MLCTYSGVSVWTPHYQFLKFIPLFHAKTEISKALKTGTWNHLCLVTSPPLPRFRYPLYIYFRSRTNIHYTRFVCWHCSRFDDLTAHSRIKTFFFLVNTCTINIRYTNIKTMWFAHAYSSGLSVTYISDLRLQLRPFMKCSLRSSYLLGLMS